MKKDNKRKEHDFYPTPVEEVEKILKYIDLRNRGNKVLEPGAGNGNIVETVKKQYPNKHMTSIEIREEEELCLTLMSDKVIIDDFLSLDIKEKYDVIIGNPPFTLAKEFVEKSLSLLNDEGILIFLLRTAFLESQKRYEFWQKNPINGLYVLSKRPSFTGTGTDTTCYSWFIWDKRSNNHPVNVI